MAPTVDIVIVSFNTRPDTLACLESLYASAPKAIGTVFVVDNASTDGSVEAIRAAWPAVDVIPLPRNAGFGAANNVALRRSTATFALLLNSDTIVPAGAIDALLSRLEATGATAIGPRLVDDTGRPELSFGRMLTPLSEMGQMVRGRLARSERPWLRQQMERQLATERRVDWVSGACLLVRRAEAAAAGFFDERYFLYEEDVDLCAALRARGGQVWFTPHATVVHRGGRSGAPASGHYDRSHLAFYAKHSPRWVPLLRTWMRLRGRRGSRAAASDPAARGGATGPPRAEP